MKRIALALIACLWASGEFSSNHAFAQAPARTLQQSEIGSGNSGYPPGSTPLVGANTGTTAGTSAQLTGSQSQFTYLCGFSVSPGSATAAITISVTMINAGGNTTTWFVGAPATAAGITGAILTVTFASCLRSGSVNQSILVNAGALGAGGVNQTVNVWGYTE